MSSIHIDRTPLWPTVLLLLVSAVAGTIIGAICVLFGVLITTTLAAPFMFLILLPVIITQFATTIVYAVIIVPLWGLIGGKLFTVLSLGKGGSIAREYSLTFLSTSHPISLRTNELAANLGLPPIKHIGWYKGQTINAFAAGENASNAMVVLSQGAVENLSKEDIDAILAHELAHIANNDMARMTYARNVQESLTFLLVFRGLKKFARWVFTPVSEMFVLSMSRKREFSADAVSAKLVGSSAMINVLHKLDSHNRSLDTSSKAYESFRISARENGLFRTHPTTKHRIEKLKIRPHFASKPNVLEQAIPSEI